ncbi:MAG: CoA-binding protein [Anaerolineae bacterium]|nr:CoA-binding protein [Anaerolineae bacterium]
MPDKATLHDILSTARIIAVVGHSEKPHRTSYQIAQALRQFGYTVYPVNPTVKTINGEPCYASLKEVPEPIDIVNVFRRSEYLMGVVEEAIEVGAKVVWAQLGVSDPQAAALAEDAGLQIVMDNCIKVSYLQLMR